MVGWVGPGLGQGQGPKTKGKFDNCFLFQTAYLELFFWHTYFLFNLILIRNI